MAVVGSRHIWKLRFDDPTTAIGAQESITVSLHAFTSYVPPQLDHVKLLRSTFSGPGPANQHEDEREPAPHAPTPQHAPRLLAARRNSSKTPAAVLRLA